MRALVELNGLQTHVFQATDGPPTGAVVLCHGYGAPGDDLVGLGPELARAFPSLERFRFFFPEAPLDLGFGRAWWPIDMLAVQRLATDANALREFRKQEPPGMAAARQKLLKLFDEVCLSTQLPAGRVVLGGFSQGSMLACDVTLRLEEPPAALVVLSGTLLTEDVWSAKATDRAGLHVFQSHGRYDPILPYPAAEWLRELLHSAGLHVEFVPFDGGHGIGPEAFTALGTFLTRRLQSPEPASS